MTIIDMLQAERASYANVNRTGLDRRRFEFQSACEILSNQYGSLVDMLNPIYSWLYKFVFLRIKGSVNVFSSLPLVSSLLDLFGRICVTRSIFETFGWVHSTLHSLLADFCFSVNVALSVLVYVALQNWEVGIDNTSCSFRYTKAPPSPPSLKKQTKQNKKNIFVTPNCFRILQTDHRQIFYNQSCASSVDSQPIPSFETWKSLTLHGSSRTFVLPCDRREGYQSNCLPPAIPRSHAPFHSLREQQRFIRARVSVVLSALSSAILWKSPPLSR